MGAHAIKMTVALIFVGFALLNACNDTHDDPNGNVYAPEKFQVYDYEGTPYNETCVLVGRPLIPSSLEGPGSSTVSVDVYPWTVGKITDGKIAIGFPDAKREQLELSADFENSYTEGVRICIFYIEHKDISNRKFGLRKRNPDNNMGISFSDVYIYYSSADFHNPSHNGISLKAGWNFIERLQNPNWSYPSDEPYFIMGATSQDVNDFLEKGYRWYLELWT